MPDITLADYTGYILLELTKAREMADAYSRQVAERYKDDEVLQHFSTPRFKIPKMEITVPVLISGARYTQELTFDMALADFQKLLSAQVGDALRTVSLSTTSAGQMVPPPVAFELPGAPALETPRTRSSSKRGNANTTRAVTRAPSFEGIYKAFHGALSTLNDLRYPESLIEMYWREILYGALNTAGLLEAYRASNPRDELLRASLVTLTNNLKGHIVIKRTTITNLLVNPETNNVKNGSSDSSVFTIKAELVEEGFFIRSIRDDGTGDTRSVVDFD